MHRMRTRQDWRIPRVRLNARSSVSAFLRKALRRRRVVPGVESDVSKEAEQEHRDAHGDNGALQETRPPELSSQSVNRRGLSDKDRVRSLEEAVAEGDASAMCELASILENGECGMPRNVRRAVELYQQAISQPADSQGTDSRAMFSLANILDVGADGVEKDLKQAVVLYDEVIETDTGENVQAMVNLARLLLSGENGVEKDTTRAIRLYERAIEIGGNVEAMVNLGWLLSSGEHGIQKDTKRAIELYERAIREGDDDDARIHLGLLFEGGKDVRKDVSRAIQLYESAIAKGNTTAMLNLADILESGRDGTEPDIQRAIDLYERALDEDGSAYAMCRLAEIFEFGKGGAKRDTRRAILLYELAIREHGYVPAMISLASGLYARCGKREKDLERAVRLCERAIAEDGSIVAMNMLAIMLLEGTDEGFRDAKRASQLLETAVEEDGDVWAMRNLSYVLECGFEGVGRDLKRSVQLLERASAEGDTDAMTALGWKFQWGLHGLEKDLIRAVSLYDNAIETDEHVNAMTNLAFILWCGADGIRKDPGRAVMLLERAVKNERCSEAMRLLAEVLRQGDIGVNRDVQRAALLLEEGVKNPAMGIPGEDMLNSLALARLLLSEESGSLRNPSRARSLLEYAIGEKFAPAYYDLALLLERGDSGVPQDLERAEKLFVLAKACGIYEPLVTGARSNSPFADPVGVDKLCTDKKKPVAYKSGYCPLLLVGGPGRGKTSLNRVLRSMTFAAGSFPSEVVHANDTDTLHVKPLTFHEGSTQIQFSSGSLHAYTSRPKPITHGPAKDWRNHPISELDAKSTVPNHEDTKTSYNTDNIGIEVAQPSEGRAKLRGPDAEDCRQGSDDTLGSSEKSSTQKSYTRFTTYHRHQNPRSSDSESKACREHLVSYSPPGRSGTRKREGSGLMEQGELCSAAGSTLIQCWDLPRHGQCELGHGLLTGYASILVFVVDLARLSRRDTQLDEIRELCRWIQIAHYMCHDPKIVEPIIVGTHKGSCQYLEEAMQVLRNGLLHELGNEAYDDWVRRNGVGGGGKDSFHFVAIEIKAVESDPKGSGLMQLADVVNAVADQIVERREEIPVRWTSLMEELEQRTELVMRRSEVNRLVADLRVFDSDKAVRERDAINALEYYQKLGRVVLHELDNGEYCVFVHPTKILEIVQAVTTPKEVMIQRVGRAHAEHLNRGVLSRRGLAILWKDYPSEAHELIVDLLCKCDVLMRIKLGRAESVDELFGLPALLPTDENGLRWRIERDQTELTLVTKFERPVHPGLSGSLIAHLHRTLGEEKTTYDRLRSNAAIFEVVGSGQVAVVFRAEWRQVIWVVRAHYPIAVAHRALRCLDGFVDKWLRRALAKRKDFITANCPKAFGGCGGYGCVTFELPERWKRNETLRQLPNLEGECFDGQQWLLRDLPSVQPHQNEDVHGEERFILKSASMPYDVFICHSTEDKHCIAYPLRDVLRALGWRVFLNEENFRQSEAISKEHIRAAIRGSRMAIFILSPSFVCRKHPMLELKLFVEERDAADADERRGPILFPMFYKLSAEQCGDAELPRRREFRALFERGGFFSDDNQRYFSTKQAMDPLQRLSTFAGVRNDRGESERDLAIRTARALRDEFVNSYRQE